MTQLTAPDPPRCQTTLGSVPTLPAAGGRTSVGVIAQRECSWSASTTAAWIKVSPTSGQGEAALTLDSSENPAGTPRTATVTVNGTPVTVTQAASPCTFTVSPTDVPMPFEGGSASARVTTRQGCTWSAASSAAWAAVTPSSGEGSRDVTLAIGPNGSPSARTATVTIAGRTVTVSQAPFVPKPSPPAPEPVPSPSPSPSPSPGPTPPPTTPPPPSPPPPPADSCSYAIDPLLRTTGSKGGDEKVEVRTDRDCGWTVESNVDWIKIKGPGSRTGSGDVKYDVEKNKSPWPRVGSLTIAGQLHTVAQAGD